MSKRVKVHVGALGDMGKRFVSAWHRLERGEKVRERHVTFPDLPAMLNTLTPKRLELLRDVHREPAASVKALAVRLGRDYKRVHEDVETLLMIVSPEAGNPTRTQALHRRWFSTGRLAVDVDVDPTVDHHNERLSGDGAHKV